MDDEESNYHAMQEILYRVETGNYEYRFLNVFLFVSFRTEKFVVS